MEKTTIGVVGGGQLCRMMGEAIAARSLPYSLIALDPTERCPAYDFLTAQVVGDFKDPDKIRELARRADVLTYEIELAGSRVLEELEAEGKPVHPDPETLTTIQDKYIQACFLEAHKIPVPNFMRIENSPDFARAMSMFGLPLMVKARRDSYDGQGNYILQRPDQVEDVLRHFAARELMIQRYIPFDSEVSVIAARNTHGEILTYPVAENIHGRDYTILTTTIVPARVSPEVELKAQAIAADVMQAFKGAGVFGIEMLVHGDDVFVNEIAPRVHNSGHYTIEACEISQFEQHLLAITGQALQGGASVPAVMHNIIGLPEYTGPYQIAFAGKVVEGTVEVQHGVHVHNYMKHTVKPWRKIGHLTVVGKTGETAEKLLQRSVKVKDLVQIRLA